MPAPTALDSAKTGTPDATNGIQIGTVISAESTQIELPVGVSLSDHIASNLAAHRSTVAAPDTGPDMFDFGSTPTSAELINNRGALAIWMQFGCTCGRCTVSPIFYDNQSTPAPVAFGPQLTFIGNLGYLTSASGKALTRVQLVDTYGFRRFKIHLDSLTNSTTDGVNIYAVPV